MFIPTDVTDLKRLEKVRRSNIHRLAHQENIYFNSIKLLHNFSKEMELHPSVSKDQVKTIFGNIKDLIDINTQLNQKLEPYLSNESERLFDECNVGNIYLSLFNLDNSADKVDMSKLYLKYVSQLKPSFKLMTSLTESDMLKQCINAFNQNVSINLESLLLLAPKHILDRNKSIKELSKNTAGSHDDKKRITLASVKFRNLEMAIYETLPQLNKNGESLWEESIKSNWDFISKQELQPIKEPNFKEILTSHKTESQVIKEHFDLAYANRKFICKGSVWEVISEVMIGYKFKTCKRAFLVSFQ